ncbi:MAG: DegT/DnrJ/EryC1/StrS family aminotransferase [bacterium]|nr:DegT/DnrJ/EryC1/StrS family aminotransferase [bacterium]
MIPYVDLPAHNRPLRDEILAAVARVLEHGMFILGPEVAELERRLAERLGGGAVVGVGSGTDALILALHLRSIDPDDEVLTVSHSFVATANAIALSGAKPVFVDIDERTMLIDPRQLEQALTPRTRAVIAVHLNGFPCEMAALDAFCERHNLVLVEDCAQAFGSCYRGRPVGSFGIGCFSLHPLKSLSACGDAGFIWVRDDADAEELRLLRNHGLRDRDRCGQHSVNSRLDTLQAAILLVKLRHFDGWFEARRRHAAAYRQALAGRVVLPPEEGENTINYSAFAIRHRERDRLRAELLERGIDVKVHYPLGIHQQPAYAYDAPSLPVTERVVSEILSLPVTPELSDVDRETVVARLLECLDRLEA